MYELNYQHFKSSLKHLEVQFGNYRSLDGDTPTLMQEAVAESVIRRFEICYDTLWKMLRKYMTAELGLPDLPASPKPIFRMAAENRLLNGETGRWLSYADARTNTSHDYSLAKAQEALQLTGQFITDATALYERMTGESWR